MEPCIQPMGIMFKLSVSGLELEIDVLNGEEASWSITLFHLAIIRRPSQEKTSAEGLVVREY